MYYYLPMIKFTYLKAAKLNRGTWLNVHLIICIIHVKTGLSLTLRSFVGACCSSTYLYSYCLPVKPGTSTKSLLATVARGSSSIHCYFIIGPRRKKTSLRGFANNKGANQPALSRSLISTFVVCLLKSTIPRLATTEISMF